MKRKIKLKSDFSTAIPFMLPSFLGFAVFERIPGPIQAGLETHLHLPAERPYR